MRHQFILLIFLFMLIACSSSSDGKEIPVEDNAFDLHVPSLNEEVDYCCFTFEWEKYKETSEYQVLIANDPEFADVAFDLTTATNSLNILEGLEPGKTYYWKVLPKFQDGSAVSSFKVKDYAKIYAGEYPAIRQDVTIVNGQVTEEESISTTIKIEEDEQSCCLLIDEMLFSYYPKLINPNHIVILDNINNDRGGYIYFNADSLGIIHVTYHDEGSHKTCINAKLK